MDMRFKSDTTEIWFFPVGPGVGLLGIIVSHI